MRRLLCIFLFAALPITAQGPFVRATLEPAKNILVGQPVHLSVTVYVPNYFTGSPDFPEFDLPNAVVVLPQDRPQNTNTTIGSTTYAGITQVYTIYPQQAGGFKLPKILLEVPYASAPPKTTIAHVALPQLSFTADVPAAAKQLPYFLPTTQLTMRQKWLSEFKHLKAGDTFQRTITVTALHTQAMMIPPLPFDAPDGIRVYTDQPHLQNQMTALTVFVAGVRTESAKYLILKEGDYTLPAVEVQWWNTTSNKLMTATLPPVHFTAAANPDFVAELPPEMPPTVAPQPAHVSFWQRYKQWFLKGIPAVAVLLIVGWLAWTYLLKMYRSLKTWRWRRAHSEEAYFHHTIASLRRNHAEASYKWLLEWLTVAYPGVNLRDFTNRTGDTEFIAEMNALGAQLYSSARPDAWNGARLAHLLRQYRTHETRHIQNGALPPLNPKDFPHATNAHRTFYSEDMHA